MYDEKLKKLLDDVANKIYSLGEAEFEEFPFPKDEDIALVAYDISGRLNARLSIEILQYNPGDYYMGFCLTRPMVVPVYCIRIGCKLFHISISETYGYFMIERMI